MSNERKTDTVVTTLDVAQEALKLWDLAVAVHAEWQHTLSAAQLESLMRPVLRALASAMKDLADRLESPRLWATAYDFEDALEAHPLRGEWLLGLVVRFAEEYRKADDPQNRPALQQIWSADIRTDAPPKEGMH